MGLADWFRRHRNTFSYSNREVDAPGEEETLREEYGERAVEERRTSDSLFGGLEVSEDEIENTEPPPDPAR